MFTLQTFRVIKSPESTLLYLAYCPGAVPSFNLCAKIGHIVVAERYFFSGTNNGSRKSGLLFKFLCATLR